MIKRAPRQKYEAYVKLKAILSFSLYARSPEEALAAASKAMASKHFVNPAIEYIDGQERLMGVTENWDL